jgi:hypothetical protein
MVFRASVHFEEVELKKKEKKGKKIEKNPLLLHSNIWCTFFYISIS